MIDDENTSAYDGSSAEDAPRMTAREVMELLRISYTTLSNWRKKGRLTTYRCGVRNIFFDYQEVLALFHEINSIKRI